MRTALTIYRWLRDNEAPDWVTVPALFASLGTRFFQAELQKLRPNGLTMWIGVPLLMLAAGIIAAWWPARRAARVDPIIALRWE